MKKNARMEIVYSERCYTCRYAGDDDPNDIKVTITRWRKKYPNISETVVISRQVCFEGRYVTDTQSILRSGLENSTLQRLGIKEFDQLKADYPHVLAEVNE